MPSRNARRPAVRRLVTWLLGSPFAGILDGSVLLLAVRGRRTGTQYTLPVQYAQDGEAIWVVAGNHEHKRWWRNLLVAAPVGLRLRGRDLPATAQAFSGLTAPSLVEDGLVTYLRRFPTLGRRTGVLDRDGGIRQDRLHELAERVVVVRIVPTDAAAGPVGDQAVTDPAPSPGVVGVICRHPLGSFYALTFLFSWSYWIPDAISGGHLSHTPGLLGPMLSALVVTAITQGRAGVRDLAGRMVRWQVRPIWYLWALAPLVVAVAAAAVMSVGPSGFPKLAAWAQMQGFPSAGLWGTWVLILVVNAYGEETGWRGFALPRFRQRHNQLQASVLVCLPWALWHVPTFFLDTGYRDFPLVLLPGFLLGIFAGSLVLTWLYEGARSSILLVALWHLALNLGSATSAGEGAVSVVVTMFVIVWAILITRAWRRADQAAHAPTGAPRTEERRMTPPGARDASTTPPTVIQRRLR